MLEEEIKKDLKWLTEIASLACSAMLTLKLPSLYQQREKTMEKGGCLENKQYINLPLSLEVKLPYRGLPMHTGQLRPVRLTGHKSDSLCEYVL